jgi:hypothetical protein
MKVNNLAVVISSLSLPLIKEAVKVFSSSIFSCSYNKNIILDASLQTYSLLMCPSSISYFFVVFLSFLAMFSVSIAFLLLEDRRMSSLMLILSFFFLFTDILLFFYGKISYLFLLPFLPFMLSTFMKKIE